MSFFQLRFLAAPALALALSAAPGFLVAAEHAASAPAAAAGASAPAASRPTPGAQDAPVHALGPRDPMEMLRERLQQRLGVVQSPDPKDPNLVRVETKSNEPAAKANDRSPPPHRIARHAIAADAATHATHPLHWDYAGAGGPPNWAKLAPEFVACGAGSRQSPIDIRDGIKVDLEPIRFGYQPGAFRVIDDGHTVQVNVAPGNFLEVNGRRYELVEFHFHAPSEELVNGKRFDMELQLVHKSAQGKLAVLALLLESGSAQGIVQSVWNNLPLEKGMEVPANGMLDLNELLPAQRGYYTYMGSLTTPPCSEGVLWMVMKQPVSVSPEQIAIFSRLYPMNARPVQPMGDRLIKESN